MDAGTAHAAGLLLAAGSGTRFGGPKALTRYRGVPLIRRAATALAAGGCDPVLAVLGAQAERAAALLAPTAGTVHIDTVHAGDWELGMGHSLRAGLHALAQRSATPDAVLIMLVDTPDVGTEVIGRVAARAHPVVVARACFRGQAGHPVLLGRQHWAELAASLTGDRGARDWLRAHPPELVECGDLATGADVDTPEQLATLESGAPVERD